MVLQQERLKPVRHEMARERALRIGVCKPTPSAKTVPSYSRLLLFFALSHRLCSSRTKVQYYKNSCTSWCVLVGAAADTHTPNIPYIVHRVSFLRASELAGHVASLERERKQIHYTVIFVRCRNPFRKRAMCVAVQDAHGKRKGVRIVLENRIRVCSHPWFIICLRMFCPCRSLES